MAISKEAAHARALKAARTRQMNKAAFKPTHHNTVRAHKRHAKAAHALLTRSEERVKPKRRPRRKNTVPGYAGLMKVMTSTAHHQRKRRSKKA